MSGFELYETYDREGEERKDHKEALEKRLAKDYLSFYEKLSRFLKLDILSLSLLFTALLFGIHILAAYFQAGADTEQVLGDYSFMLALLNGAGLFLILTATDKLRDFIANLTDLSRLNYKDRSDEFVRKYRSKFLGSRTVMLAIAFGLLNCAFALIFGIPYLKNAQYLLLGSFLLQTFLIGFIGGITVNATIVVVRMIRSISDKEHINLRYFYPDQCAGTLIIGNILFLFAMHFIIIGVFIFLFIHNFPWSNVDENPMAAALLIFWKLFPFLLSAIIYFLPAQRINKVLRDYKLYEQLRLRKRMNHIAELIMGMEPGRIERRDELEVLDSHFQKLKAIDIQIGEMNTWPYNLRARTTFLAIFLPVIIGIVLEISKKLLSQLV